MKSFEMDILPSRFGLQALNRDNIINNHTTTIAKKLFDVQENMFLICDGTYARHQKSTGQKKVPLCKPFSSVRLTDMSLIWSDRFSQIKMMRTF